MRIRIRRACKKKRLTRGQRRMDASMRPGMARKENRKENRKEKKEIENRTGPDRSSPACGHACLRRSAALQRCRCPAHWRALRAARGGDAAFGRRGHGWRQ